MAYRLDTWNLIIGGKLLIEFNGELSEQCRLDGAKRRNRNTLFIFLIALAMFGVIPTIVLGILKQTEFYYFLGMTILLAVLTVLNTIPLPGIKKRVLKFKADIRIRIENGVIINSNFYNQKTKPISKVKKVIDAGEWYYLIFKFGDISNSWVCQKDLITQGTIEEFEKLFENKIVRK